MVIFFGISFLKSPRWIVIWLIRLDMKIELIQFKIE
jgi:hypothetical protein